MSNSSIEYQPTIPNVVRTGAYVIGLVAGFVIIIINGIAQIWWPAQAVDVLATTGAVGTALGWLSSALGVAYRPTAASVARHAAPPTL